MIRPAPATWRIWIGASGRRRSSYKDPIGLKTMRVPGIASTSLVCGTGFGQPGRGSSKADQEVYKDGKGQEDDSSADVECEAVQDRVTQRPAEEGVVGGGHERLADDHPFLVDQPDGGGGGHHVVDADRVARSSADGLQGDDPGGIGTDPRPHSE